MVFELTYYNAVKNNDDGLSRSYPHKGNLEERTLSDYNNKHLDKA